MAPRANFPEFHLHVTDINRTQNTVKIKAEPRYFSAAESRARAYKNLPFHFKFALERVADYVRIEMVPRTFDKEGPGWKPLAKRTVAERVEAGYQGKHPILKRTGDLFKELSSKSHPKHIEIIKTGKHARIEIGGSSEKFVQNQTGKGVAGQRLPARPMVPGTGNIPLPDRDRMAIKHIIDKSIKERMKR